MRDQLADEFLEGRFDSVMMLVRLRSRELIEMTVQAISRCLTVSS